MNEKITMYSPPFPRLKSYIDVIDLACEYTVDSSKFISMGKATPFEGYTVYGKNILTVLRGKQIV